MNYIRMVVHHGTNENNFNYTFQMKLAENDLF